MANYLAVPESGNGAGVLVLHAWWGLTPYFTSVCDRLAQAGYVALAPDLYHGKTAATIEEAEALLKSFDGDAATQETAQAAEVLLSQPQVSKEGIGLVGFSLGANVAQGFAAEPNSHVAATIVFYDALDGDYTQSPSAFQFHMAETDDWLDEEGFQNQKKQLQALGKEAEYFTYPGTGHWFVEADRPDAYDAQAAELAWDRTLTFLNNHLT